MYELLGTWEQSGQSRAAFCKEAGLSYSLFQYWLGRYRREKQSPSEIGFTEVKGEPELAAANFIRIRHPNGILLEIDRSVSTSYIRELLQW